MNQIILTKDRFPNDIGGGLEDDLVLNDISESRPWCVAFANKRRLSKAESEKFRLKLMELTGFSWETDVISKFIFHYKGEKIMAKKKTKKGDITEEAVQAAEAGDEMGEQLDLIDVGPENLEKIAPHARRYKAALKKRLADLDLEVKEKNIIQQLVHESGLKRLPDGSIKFRCEGMRIELIPTDEKIKIKEDEE